MKNTARAHVPARSVSSFFLFAIAAAVSIIVASVSAGASDVDGDGVLDTTDNCLGRANPGQRDTDFDGYGNRCDADLNNDLRVNSIDLGLFRSQFLTANADADFNGDAVVNIEDLGILRELYFQRPGPSAVPWQVLSSVGGTVSISIPGDLIAQEGKSSIVVGDEDNLAAGLAPTFAMTVFNVPDSFSDLPLEEALIEVALFSGLEQLDIEEQISSPRGLFIVAKSFTRRHFFRYSATNNVAVQFLSGEPEYFESSEFSVILDRLEF